MKTLVSSSSSSHHESLSLFLEAGNCLTLVLVTDGKLFGIWQNEHFYREFSEGFHWLVPGENLNYIHFLASYFSLIVKNYIYYSGIIFTLLKESLGHAFSTSEGDENCYDLYSVIGWHLKLCWRYLLLFAFCNLFISLFASGNGCHLFTISLGFIWL